MTTAEFDNIPDDVYLPRPKVAKWLGLSPDTVTEMAQQGDLIGFTYRIRSRDRYQFLVRSVREFLRRAKIKK